MLHFGTTRRTRKEAKPTSEFDFVFNLLVSAIQAFGLIALLFADCYVGQLDNRKYALH